MYVYIIRSTVRKWNYVGITNNIESRINRHNLGREKSTKLYSPFTLIFAQEVDGYKNARVVEKFLKISFNKEALLELMPMW